MCHSSACTLYILYVSGIFAMNFRAFKCVRCVAYIPFTETL